jgi:hypothetical protein
MKHAGLVAIFVSVATTSAIPQNATTQRNLEVCLSGKYPALCNRAALTPDQLQQVRAAEIRENLQRCMTGKYPALCDHSMLNAAQAAAVKEAERLENLRICSSGKYPALCNLSLLTAAEITQVRVAEAAENLRICLDGRYPSLCRRSLLEPSQAKQVATAEAKAASLGTQTQRQNPVRRAGPSGCEAGHWIESVDGNGSIIKLENGSLWKVDDIDTVFTAIWLPISEVLICGTKMINVEDDESVGVTRLVPTPPSRSDSPTSRKQGYLLEASADDETS